MSGRILLAAARATLAFALAGPLWSGSAWEPLFQEGLQADDLGDYDKATTSLRGACEIAIAEPGSGPQSTACESLATVQAVDGDLKGARKTLEALVDRLNGMQDAAPRDIVSALILLANVHSANGSPDAAVDALKSALPFQEKVTPIDKALMLFRMAKFYLPFDDKTAGQKLLLSGQMTLASAVDYQSPEYVRAATEFVWVLLQANRADDAERVTAKLLAEGDRVFADPETPAADLGAAYIELAQQARNRQGPADENPSDPKDPTNLVNAWRARVGQAARPYTVNAGEVSFPKLISRRDPAYTRGAREAGVEGTVLFVIEIWPDGKAHNVRVVRDLPYGLVWAATAAVRKWRFAPALKGGEPVKALVSVEVNFRLLNR